MTFPAEEFLLEPLPDYAEERYWLVMKLVLAILFWATVVPMLLSREVVVSKTDHSKETVTTKRRKQTLKKSPKPVTITEPTTTQRIVDPATWIYCLGWCLMTLLFFIQSAPDNTYTARGVFEAPLFTRHECQSLTERAEAAAVRNYKTATNESQGFLQEPYGWQKTRHGEYPTTDLNLVVDPFTKEDRAWVQTKLDARLAPMLSRIYGIPASSIRANDLFLVRYDGDRQAHLSRHIDSGELTFAALLSEGFEGGGTQYWDRNEEAPFVNVLPSIGQMTMFAGPILHEGVQVDKGRRYLLIGFLNVDRVDPWTAKPTGLPWLASWGSFNWLAVRCKDASNAITMNLNNGPSTWTSNSYTKALFTKLKSILLTFGDVFQEHHFTTLVDEKHAKEYLQVMDDHHAMKQVGTDQASWYAGQLINTNFDGSIHSLWRGRAHHGDRFEPDQI